MKTTQEYAKETADYIRTHGWTQHRLKDGKTGNVCIRGAMEEVCWVEVKGLGKMTHGLVGLVEAFKRRTNSYPMTFNDTKERTVEEVLSVLDDIAKEK